MSGEIVGRIVDGWVSYLSHFFRPIQGVVGPMRVGNNTLFKDMFDTFSERLASCLRSRKWMCHALSFMSVSHLGDVVKKLF